MVEKNTTEKTRDWATRIFIILLILFSIMRSSMAVERWNSGQLEKH
jgi:hypothetical protein